MCHHNTKYVDTNDAHQASDEKILKLQILQFDGHEKSTTAKASRIANSSGCGVSIGDMYASRCNPVEPVAHSMHIPNL